MGNGQVASRRGRGGRAVRRVTVEKVASEDKRLMLMIEAVEYDDDEDESEDEEGDEAPPVCARFNV